VFFATRQSNGAPEPEMIDRDRKRTTEPEILDPGPAAGKKGLRERRDIAGSGGRRYKPDERDY
jgi:hypothetical protein